VLLEFRANLSVHGVIEELAEFVKELLTCKQRRRPPFA
jgi:hypothetical protein